MQYSISVYAMQGWGARRYHTKVKSFQEMAQNHVLGVDLPNEVCYNEARNEGTLTNEGTSERGPDDHSATRKHPKGAVRRQAENLTRGRG